MRTSGAKRRPAAGYAAASGGRETRQPSPLSRSPLFLCVTTVARIAYPAPRPVKEGARPGARPSLDTLSPGTIAPASLVAGFPALSPRPGLRSSLAHTTPIQAPIPTSVPSSPLTLYSKARSPLDTSPPAHARSFRLQQLHATDAAPKSRIRTLPFPFHRPAPCHHRTPAARPWLHHQPRLPLPHHTLYRLPVRHLYLSSFRLSALARV
jgi:hypothetical protein